MPNNENLPNKNNSSESILPHEENLIVKGTKSQKTIETNQKSSTKETSSESQVNSITEIKPILDTALIELRQERKKLEEELKELSLKKTQLEKENKSYFTGQSDLIARKVKGFQEYLTGALTDLAQTVDQLELVSQPVIVQPSPLDKELKDNQTDNKSEYIAAISDTFKPDEHLIRNCLNQFLEQPDFYADPWKLRRSLDKQDIDFLDDWFFSMGGRGAQPSRGNRPKNILITAGIISIFGELYGEQFQTLVLASQPERLGEWRRGLQDSLGLNREDFGPNSGIVLFERADGLIERADRLESKGDLPLIIIDAAEIHVEIPILQFPVWLAFAGSPEEIYDEDLL